MRVTVALYTSKTANISRALYQATHCFYSGRLVFPAHGKFLDRMPQLRQELIRGVFQTKASSAISRRAFKSPCACPTKKISIHGMRRCLHCLLHGLISLTLSLTTSRSSAHQLLFIRMQMGGVSHVGGISLQWHL